MSNIVPWIEVEIMGAESGGGGGEDASSGREISDVPRIEVRIFE